MVLIDDHALFRRGVRQLLHDEGLRVIGEASNGKAGVKLVGELRPEVVVMDLSMPVMDGIEATRRLASNPECPPVLVLTMTAEDDAVVDALEAGAIGYLLKDADAATIAAGVRAAAEGDSVLSPSVAAKLVDRVRSGAGTATATAEPSDELTERELEILAQLAQGKENTQIAAELYLSPKTVKNYVASILEKLGLDNRVQAAVYAVRHGLG